MARQKTNYFPHDSNARNDDKIISLRIIHGMEGYGTYFALLERLRDEDGYRAVANYEAIAFDLRADTELVRSVVEDFGLFVVEDGYFFSPAFNSRMNALEEKREKRKKAVEERWKRARENAENTPNDTKCTENDTNVLQMDIETDTSKVKYTKESKIYPPSNPPKGKVGEEGFISLLKTNPNALTERDGIQRNYPGLIDALKALGIPGKEAAQICALSNYGQIGHPVWLLLAQCRDSASKRADDKTRIKFPGKFIISQLTTK